MLRMMEVVIRTRLFLSCRYSMRLDLWRYWTLLMHILTRKTHNVLDIAFGGHTDGFNISWGQCPLMPCVMLFCLTSCFGYYSSTVWRFSLSLEFLFLCALRKVSLASWHITSHSTLFLRSSTRCRLRQTAENEQTYFIKYLTPTGSFRALVWSACQRFVLLDWWY